eukprot:4521388-Alexandrium_andersonii.AAC.1
MGLCPSTVKTSGGRSPLPGSRDGTRSGTGSMSALSGLARHPKGRKKGTAPEEIATRGAFCPLPYSRDKAYRGASQGQKKFQMNTE